MNKWHKKQVFAPGYTPRFMTPPLLGAEGQKGSVIEGKRQETSRNLTDEISDWKGSSTSSHLLYPGLFGNICTELPN